MTASARKAFERRQRRWADEHEASYDARGFVRELDDNLFRPLTPATRAEFERGSELKAGRSMPARLWSLTSSAALVANVFDHWRERDTSPLVAALGLGEEPAALTFERPFATGLTGDPPLSDVVLQWPSGRVAAIESKFGEWLVRRPRNKMRFKTKYFPDRGQDGVWLRVQRERCQALAEAIQGGRERYRFLNVPQLLKHALGLAQSGGDAALVYLYYDWPCREAAAHAEELERFSGAVRGEIEFRALTYQSLFAALKRTPGVDPEYCAYLERRYFA